MFSTIPLGNTVQPMLTNANVAITNTDGLQASDSDETMLEDSENSESGSDVEIPEAEETESYAENTLLGDNWFEVYRGKTQKSPKIDNVYPLPCNLFTTGALDTCLVEHSCPRRACHSIIEYNAVQCQNALLQKIPPGLDVLKHLERINMIHQLPDLNTVAIATQAGRVGLLTLTYWPAEQRYGFRIEAILPFKSQEDKGFRPSKPLLGMAIGPIQGYERKVHSQSNIEGEDFSPNSIEIEGRYRLIMLYYDHTVLSYEVSRPNETGDLSVI